MVLTQDCDLVHHRLEDEPWAELIPLRPLGPYNKDRDNPCLYGKNPRRLVFQVEGESPTAWWCLEPHSRFRIPRGSLTSLTPDPDGSLPEKTAQVLARWMSRRYTRAAMADAFNCRLNRKSRELGDLWKGADAEAISGVYVLGAREELPGHQDYQIKVLLSVISKSQGVRDHLEMAQRVSQRLDEILSSCPGMTVLDIREDLERDITLEDLRHYGLFELDLDARLPLGDTLPTVVPVT